MWNPTGPTRNALAFLMAAAVSFLGGAVLLKAGRFPPLTGGQVAAGRPGTLLLAIVVLLGVTGALLVAMAGKEFLDQHRGRPTRGEPRPPRA